MPRRRSSTARDTVAYSIYDRDNKRTYIGSTNNPRRRASEHAKSGKLEPGGKLVVESRKMTRKSAQNLEGKKIRGYHNRTGKLPKNNFTSNGRWNGRFR